MFAVLSDPTKATTKHRDIIRFITLHGRLLSVQRCSNKHCSGDREMYRKNGTKELNSNFSLFSLAFAIRMEYIRNLCKNSGSPQFRENVVG